MDDSHPLFQSYNICFNLFKYTWLHCAIYGGKTITIISNLAFYDNLIKKNNFFFFLLNFKEFLLKNQKNTNVHYEKLAEWN